MDDDALLEAIKKHKCFAIQMRAGSADSLATALEKHIDNKVSDIIDQVATFDMEGTESEAGFFENAHGFLNIVLGEVAMPIKADWTGALGACARVIPVIASSQVLDALEVSLAGVDATNISNTSVLTGLVSSAQKVSASFLTAQPKAAAIKAKIATVFALIMGHIQSEGFSLDNDGAENAFSALQAFSRFLTISKDELALLNVLEAITLLKSAAAKLPSSGDRDAFCACIKEERGRQLLGDIISRHKALRSAFGDMADMTRMPIATTLFQTVQVDILDVAKSVLLADAKGLLDDFCAQTGFKDKVGGIGNGNSWKNGLRAAATMEQVLAHGTDTLLKMKAVPFSKLLDDAEMKFVAFGEECKYFDVPLSSVPGATSFQDALNEGIASRIEGTLLYNYQNHRSDQGKMKRCAIDIKRTLDKHTDIRKRIHNSLLELTDKAFRMQRL